MSVQRITINTTGSTAVGAVSRVRMVSQAVTGPADTTTAAALTAHLDDTTDAHDASAVSVADAGGNYTGTDVETVLAELPGKFATAAQGTLAGTAVQPARSISTTAPLTGGGDLSANRTLAVSAASTSATGVVELATSAETIAGTDTDRAVTPAGGAAAFAPLSNPLSFGMVFTIDPRYGFQTAAWPGANRGIYSRVIGGGSISKVGIEVGVQSGNISVAVYRSTGVGVNATPAGAPAQSSGAVACPATGFQEVSLGAAVVVNPGDWLFMSCDNTTATFGRHANTIAALGLTKGFVCRQDTAHPAPTVGTLAATSYCPVLVGIP
jgi:hypothetical protein